MIQVRKSEDRGHFQLGWLDTYHTFSFGEYHDPQFMGFRDLRVINEDRVEPGTGFGEHPHRDMEIITYIISGQLQHRDSLGNGAILSPGDVQYMAAGSGIRHSEFNPSESTPVHLMQIWILPNRRGLPARYQESKFPSVVAGNGLALLASPDGALNSIVINQDVSVWAGSLAPGGTQSLAIAEGRHGWLQLIQGRLQVNGQELESGDGAALSQESHLSINVLEESSLLFFDLK